MPSWDLDDDALNNDYISYDDLRWGVRDYIGVLDVTANIPLTTRTPVECRPIRKCSN